MKRWIKKANKIISNEDFDLDDFEDLAILCGQGGWIAGEASAAEDHETAKGAAGDLCCILRELDDADAAYLVVSFASGYWAGQNAKAKKVAKS